MINQEVNWKREKSTDIIKKTIKPNKPYFFSLQDYGSLIVTIYKPNDCLGTRPYNGKEYRILKALIHERDYKEVDFNTNHYLQLSEKIAFPLLINKLEYLKLIDADEVTVEIIKFNNFHYIINLLDSGLLLTKQNTDLRLKNSELRYQNIDTRLQNIEYRTRLIQDLTKSSPRLNQDVTKIIKEEFVGDEKND